MPDTQKSCFVLMKFGGQSDTYYSEIFRPAIQDAGFRPIRADELGPGVNFVEYIRQALDRADVVLADLSEASPSVFMEFGVAWGQGKPVVCVARDGVTLPMDLVAMRCILYSKESTGWEAKLRSALTRALLSAVEHPEDWLPRRAMPGTAQSPSPPTEPGVVSAFDLVDEVRRQRGIR